MHAGDSVYFTGTIWGIRDATYIRIFDGKVPPPVDLHGAVLLARCAERAQAPQTANTSR